MADNDDMNLFKQQQQQETAFQTQENIFNNVTEQKESAVLETMRKESLTEKESLEKKLEKTETAVAMEEIRTTEKAAATDPDDDQTGFNKDFVKTDIAFSKLPPEPPQNPRAAIKAAGRIIGK